MDSHRIKVMMQIKQEFKVMAVLVSPILKIIVPLDLKSTQLVHPKCSHQDMDNLTTLRIMLMDLVRISRKLDLQEMWLTQEVDNLTIDTLGLKELRQDTMDKASKTCKKSSLKQITLTVNQILLTAKEKEIEDKLITVISTDLLNNSFHQELLLQRKLDLNLESHLNMAQVQEFIILTASSK